MYIPVYIDDRLSGNYHVYNMHYSVIEMLMRIKITLPVVGMTSIHLEIEGVTTEVGSFSPDTFIPSLFGSSRLPDSIKIYTMSGNWVPDARP